MFFGAAVCAVTFISAPCNAGTIIKLSLGGDAAADIEFTGGAGGILSTADDADGSTTGDQNTAIEFLDILDSEPDIITSTASATLDNLTAGVPAIVVGGVFVVQNLTGGTLSLYDESNTLLLSGTLSDSTLSGTLGAPATGSVITTSFGQFTGGTLAGALDPGSLSLTIALTGINGLAGLAVTPPVPAGPPLLHEGTLNAFVADGSVVVAAAAIPEPTTVGLLVAGVGIAVGRRRMLRFA
jgi:hypothetical protein